MKIVIMQYFTKVCKLLAILTGSRKLRNRVMRNKLTSYDFNCIGGVFLHDAGKRFNSPLVNLATDGDGFIEVFKNPRSFIYGGQFYRICKFTN